jgi:Ca-activated chloride channel homolog
MKRAQRLWMVVVVLVAALGVVSLAWAERDKEERRERLKMEMAAPAMDFQFSDLSVDGQLGATPGGAQDITFARDRIMAAEIPHPNVFTPEGLLSEHDLPLGEGAAACRELFCAAGEAVEARLIAQPEVKYLAQLGFSSGLSAATFQRAPLNLVAVIDKSGSMSGQPLDLVKASLIEVVGQLGPQDQLTVVLYGDEVHVHLPTTRIKDKAAVVAQLKAIESSGSTDMEAGLALGFSVARETRASFEGTTRVMLFTDERPNVGRTDAESFMGMAEAASVDGVGMTTIGVGVQFGAELATKVSSVRGGNLFFFGDMAKMEGVFKEDFPFMVTELAYDMKLTLKAPAGLKIAGVYGIPGEALRWADDGGLSLEIATVFLSKRKGAIFVGLAQDEAAGGAALPPRVPSAGEPTLEVGLSYQLTTGEGKSQGASLALTALADAGEGLRRGRLLVNEVTTLKMATALHHEKNDQVGAYKLVHELAEVFRFEADASLSAERDLVEKLEQTLAKLAGFEGEAKPRGGLNPVSGLPIER